MTTIQIPGQSHSRTPGIGVVHNDLTIPVGGAYPDQEEIASFGATTGWTVLGNDTINLVTEANHIIGTGSLEFDKTDGLANTVFCGIQKTIDLDLSRFGPNDELQAYVYVPNKANVVNAFIRLGTDSSNYNVWQLLNASITAATWQAFHVALASCVVAVTGNGWNPAAVTYAAVGLEFDLETRALADVWWNCLRIHSSRHTRT